MKGDGGSALGNSQARAGVQRTEREAAAVEAEGTLGPPPCFPAATTLDLSFSPLPLPSSVLPPSPPAFAIRPAFVVSHMTQSLSGTAHGRAHRRLRRE